jgi:hypothetical protein
MIAVRTKVALAGCHAIAAIKALADHHRCSTAKPTPLTPNWPISTRPEQQYIGPFAARNSTQLGDGKRCPVRREWQACASEPQVRPGRVIAAGHRIMERMMPWASLREVLPSGGMRAIRSWEWTR